MTKEQHFIQMLKNVLNKKTTKVIADENIGEENKTFLGGKLHRLFDLTSKFKRILYTYMYV